MVTQAAAPCSRVTWSKAKGRRALPVMLTRHTAELLLLGCWHGQACYGQEEAAEDDDKPDAAVFPAHGMKSHHASSRFDQSEAVLGQGQSVEDLPLGCWLS